MTKQEAIETIKEIRRTLDSSEFSFYAEEALDMAIEALRDDDCQEGILTSEERSEVLNTIDEALHGYQVDGYEDTDGMFFKVLISKAESCSKEPNRSDLISRSDAIKMLWEKRQALNDYMEILLQTNMMSLRYMAKIERNRIEEDINIIEALPSVQPEDVIRITGCRKFVPEFDFNEDEPERKRGEWVNARDGYDGHVKCNKCFKTYDWTSDAQYFNYCPHCGCRMIGEDNG